MTPMAPSSGSAGLALDRWRRSLSRPARAAEGALVRAAQRGSQDAIAELFARHSRSTRGCGAGWMHSAT